MCRCICYEVPGRKKKNRRGAENRSCMSVAAAVDDASAGDVKSITHLVVACDDGKSTFLSPVDATAGGSNTDSRIV